jgi:hypothetical protein
VASVKIQPMIVLRFAILVSVGSTIASPCCVANDSSGFARLSDSKKEEIMWQLRADSEWGQLDQNGRAYQKPICQYILTRPGHMLTWSGLWKKEAIDLVDKQGWTDLAPLIRKIYESPQDIGGIEAWERAFRYVRRQESKPIPAAVIAAEETLEHCLNYGNTVTDEQVKAAQAELSNAQDKEAALV